MNAKIIKLFTLPVLFSALLFAGCKPAADTTAKPEKASVYDRVLETGVIRAGYLVYPPGCIKDPNTGKLSGVHVEVLERAAAAMGLKVEWVEATGWGSIVEDVRSGKVDMIGSPVWANSTRGKFADFTMPLFWSGICAYVRADDNRFDSDLSKINSSSVNIATIDGEMSDIIAHGDYPLANRISLPQNSDNSVMLENVARGRADVVFVEPFIANLYLKAHPGSLQNITPTRPLRVFPNAMMIPKNDPALKSMLDTALAELVNSHAVDDLLKKYAPEKGSFFLDAYPYRPDQDQP